VLVHNKRKAVIFYFFKIQCDIRAQATAWACYLCTCQILGLVRVSKHTGLIGISLDEIGSGGLASPMLHIFIGFSDDYGYDADDWTHIDNSYALRASRKKTRSLIYIILIMSARLPIIALAAHTVSYAVRALVVN
jgi:hypothetical protein